VVEESFYVAIYTRCSKTRKGKKRRSYCTKKRKTRTNHRKAFEKVKMGNKYVALLLACVVVGVCVEAFTWTDEDRKECTKICVERCIFPQKFCDFWCEGNCHSPVIG